MNLGQRLIYADEDYFERIKAINIQRFADQTFQSNELSMNIKINFDTEIKLTVHVKLITSNTEPLCKFAPFNIFAMKQ